ncbi:MAG: GDP-mannose 4,6-dehydratase [bacterium]
MPSKAKKVFITGIEGFVGYHLTSHLLSKGYDVSGMRVAPLPPNFPKIKVHQCDIKDKKRLKDLLAQGKKDAIFHLAAISSVDVSERAPELAFTANTMGTFNLLQSLGELRMNPKVILISSCEVYDRSGNQGVKIGAKKDAIPRFDEKSTTKPSSFYALTKLFAEELGRFFFDRYGLKILILRPFSHTGPGQSENFVFPSVTRRIVEIEQGKRPPVIELGNLDVFRDYTDVRDMVKAYELALLSCLPGKTYNVTSEKTYSIREGVLLLCSLAKKQIKIKIVPERFRKEGIYLAGDCRKFRKATNWKPEIDFKTTLSDLLEYSRKTIRD